MRYHLESTLPIHAFQPLGGRHSPFKQGMTLEGGGGGIIESIGDAFSGVAEGIGDALAGVDKAVGDVVPGGWGTIAAIAVPYAAPMITGAALTAGQAAALAAGTRAATGAIRGEDPEDILKGAALSAAGSYGLSSLGDAGYVPDEGSPYIDGTPPPARDFDYIPESVPLETAIQTSPDSAVPIEEFGPTDIELGRTEMSDIDPTRMEGVRSLVAESGIDPMSATGGRFDPFIGATPTSNIYTDLPVGYEFMGPNGMEIVGPNGKTYLQKDLYNALSDLSNQTSAINNSSFDGFSQNVRSDARPYMADYDPQISAFQPAGSNQEQFIIDRSQPIPNPEMLEKGYLDRMAELPGATYDMAKSYLKDISLPQAALGLGALSLTTSGGQQPQPSPAGYSSSYSPYTSGYGSSGGVADPYLLRERINTSNIYNYRNPYTSRYAQGGEVKHFALGGISNAITRFTQPIEKAIVQPVGQALPFLKDVAPYAGILAAPFITSPAMAVGVGALSSGFGRPGTGFDMKRALMGGIAAYGASTVGAGLEAAGTEPTKPLVDTLAESYAVPGTEVPVSTAAPKGFFRDTDAMQKGVGNLLSSDSDAATKAFSTKAGTFKSGVPLVMGTSGMMAIDEANKMREEAERSAGAGRQEQADMLARISKGRKRAEQAVRENPYMYAMGGQVDDELGGDYSAMGMDQGNMQKGLFGMGYAAGGQIDMGNGYNPFANLPTMSGPLGAVGGQRPAGMQPMGTSDGFNPFSPERIAALRNDPQFLEKMRVQGGGRDEQGRAVDGLGNVIERTAPSGQSFGQTMSGLSNMFNQYTPQMSPSSNQNPNINTGGFAGPSSFYGGGGGFGGGGGGSGGPFPLEGQYGIVKMAAGGMPPRFLSGGGDGMSDSIPATIEGKQEARLADGEFVIPADVVSHLGNGSSKAGAKQLYSMMDRVRKARTGNEKQGRQIKPNKMMPA